MIIGLDARPMRSEERTGVGNYIYHLWKGLQQRGHHVVLLSNRADMIVKDDDASLTTVAHQPTSNRYLWEQHSLPQLLRQHPVDVFHATWNYGIPIRYPGPAIATIHDLIPLVMQQLYRGGSPKERLASLLYRVFQSQTIRRADHILTVSKTSQQDIVDHFPRSAQKISVTYEGYDLIPNPSLSYDNEQLQRFNISGLYLVYLGGFEKRKSVETLLAAFPLIKSKHDIQLVLIGKKNEYYRHSLALQQKNGIIFTDYLPDSAMQAILRHAAILVYPSLYEGFGLPMIEAMAYGVPVIARNASALREIGTGAALLLDSVTPASLAGACDSLLTDSALREHYRTEGLKRTQQFKWTNTIVAAEQAYQRAFSTHYAHNG